MPPSAPALPRLSLVAEFPEGYFLENLTVRPDNSMLVTAVLQSELWFIPARREDETVDPIRVHSFDHLCSGIVETAPDVFHVSLCDAYTTHESHLVCVDLREWSPGDSVTPHTVVTFDDRAKGLNGSCLLAPGVLLLADCFAGLIWRVDLTEAGLAGTASVWLEHETMSPDPDSTLTPPQPGINGIRLDASASFVYYTNTAHELFMRVAVDADTHAPTGEPEIVSHVPMCDDFCMDSDSGVAFITAHRHNTLDRVPVRPGSTRSVVVGDPFDELLVGPSSAAWGRRVGEPGRVMFVTSDGGTTALPSDGVLRSAKVVRLQLA